MNTLDHPRVRLSATCPLCDLPKDVGAVVRWPCYHLWNFRHGASTLATTMIDEREKDLQP